MEISKIILKSFHSDIMKAKDFQINTQDAYVLSEISKTVFKIFLAQISKKLQIWFL